MRVLALYPDGDVDILNAQLLFYAASARHSLAQVLRRRRRHRSDDLQPQSIEPDAEMVSSVTVTHGELDEFVTVYRAACEEALTPAPRLERGAHCRFCPARPICPAHTGPLLDLAQFIVPTPLPFGGALSAPAERRLSYSCSPTGLDLVDAVKDIGKALRDQARRALESGDVVPGYALSAGRAVRSWYDESVALAALITLGLDRDDVVAETMRSVKQIETRAKAHKIKIPPELIVSTRSGTSLMRVENAHGLIPGRAEIMRDFVRALNAFQKGKANGK